MSSEKQLSPAQARLTLAIFCLIFIAAGLAMWIPWFVVPTLDWWRMRTWKPVPCTLVKSAAGQGDAFSLQPVFRYEWDGASYDSTGVGSDGMFSMGDFSLATAAPGSTRTCYVNPRDARQATLRRDFDPETLFGCAPLLFVLLPGMALILGWSKVGRPPDAPPDPLPPLREGARRIEPRARGGCGVVVLLFLILCFGGMAAGLVVMARGNGGILAYVYAVPFGLVALLLLKLLVGMGLASFNPRVALTLTPGQAAPGKTLELRWEATGNISRAKTFRIVLEGREEARVGKWTKSEPFATVDVFQSDFKDLRRGMAKATVPETAMTTLTHGSRKIIWAVKVHADCPRWPRDGEEYVFDVLPRKAAST